MTADPSVNRDTKALALGLLHRFRGRKWHAGPFQPDELVSPILLPLGFRLMDLKQGQWRLTFECDA
jgi:hypothetical protein